MRLVLLSYMQLRWMKACGTWGICIEHFSKLQHCLVLQRWHHTWNFVGGHLAGTVCFIRMKETSWLE